MLKFRRIASVAVVSVCAVAISAAVAKARFVGVTGGVRSMSVPGGIRSMGVPGGVGTMSVPSGVMRTFPGGAVVRPSIAGGQPGFLSGSKPPPGWKPPPSTPGYHPPPPGGYGPGYAWRYRPGYGWAWYALGVGIGGYSYYDDQYFGDQYYEVAPAYEAAPTYEAVPANEAVAYCTRRFRTYDPASQTYLGNDGRRHPCP